MISPLNRGCGHIVRVVLFTVVIALGFAPSATSLAMQPDMALRFPEEMETDIPAMTLSAFDYDIDGILGIYANLMGTAAYAQFLADANGQDPAAISETLDDAGFLAHVASWSGVPNPTEADSYHVGAISMVTEYGDDEGAETGYDLAVSWITGTEEIDAPVIGDQSVLIRTDSTASTDTPPNVQLDYAFQVDNYVGILTVAWFGDEVANEFDADGMAEYAEMMVERMEEADDESALSLPILRIEPTGMEALGWHDEMYDVRGGNFAWLASDNVPDLEPYVTYLEESGIETVYRVATGYLLPDGSYGSYVTRAYDLGRSRAAREWVSAGPEFFIEQDTPGGYGQFGEPVDLDGFDGDVVGVTYSWASEANGLRVWFQVDGIVYVVEADGPNGIDEDVFADIIDAQIACAEEEGYCEPIPLPDGLFR